MTVQSNSKQQPPPPQPSSSSGLSFPVTTENYAVGMARTSKLDFVQVIDMGVPIDLPKKKDNKANYNSLLRLE
jgi:hypothetical protein